MNYHFIAIGGSAMHNLAIALHKKGETISGSDDEIFEPSRSRLAKQGILPAAEGWFPERITKHIDAVVLGMHAKKDNPELKRASEMGIPIYSYPEFLFKQTQFKTRAVIGGSHGKTSTTAMVMHVLKQSHMAFDYMVGAQLEGFDTMVDFSESTQMAVFEGDEYLTSPIDPRPKFHLYKPHIGLITGIAWDHINVFPTFESYVAQFEIFANQIVEGGCLIYFKGDEQLKKIVARERKNIEYIAYHTHAHTIEKGITYLIHQGERVPLKIFGEHNLQNLSGAKQVCLKLGVREADFYGAIQSFEGAAKRLQLLGKNDKLTIYQDFAHSPSKLEATISAVKNQYPQKEVIACMELHTYSSLNKDFLSEYKNTMEQADRALVFYSHHALELKRLQHIDPELVAKMFDKEGVKVYTEKNVLKEDLFFMDFQNAVLLFLSSGNFEGINLKEFTAELLNKNS